MILRYKVIVLIMVVDIVTQTTIIAESIEAQMANFF